MAVVIVGALRGSATGERRVALDPSAAAPLAKAGRTVLVEGGAGATVVSRADVISRSDILAAAQEYVAA